MPFLVPGDHYSLVITRLSLTTTNIMSLYLIIANPGQAPSPTLSPPTFPAQHHQPTTTALDTPQPASPSRFSSKTTPAPQASALWASRALSRWVITWRTITVRSPRISLARREAWRGGQPHSVYGRRIPPQQSSAAARHVPFSPLYAASPAAIRLEHIIHILTSGAVVGLLDPYPGGSNQHIPSPIPPLIV